MFQDLKHMTFCSKCQEPYLRTGANCIRSEMFLLTYNLVTCTGWIYHVSVIRQTQEWTRKNKALEKDKIRLPSCFPHGATQHSFFILKRGYKSQRGTRISSLRSLLSEQLLPHEPGPGVRASTRTVRVRTLRSSWPVCPYVPALAYDQIHPVISGGELQPNFHPSPSPKGACKARGHCISIPP